MRLRRADPSGATVDVFWDTIQCASDACRLIYGDLANLSVYAIGGSECSIGSEGAVDGVALPSADQWLLVIANDGISTEGNWGEATAGPRNGGNASGECGLTLLDDSRTCP